MRIETIICPLALIGASASAATNHQGSWPPPSISQEVHNPSWPMFDNLTARWSTYDPPTFSEIFLPQTEHDLAVGVQYLAASNKSFLARSGGHGYSVTLQTIQNAVLINMENFAYVTLNADMTVSVGTGTTFEELIDVVGNAGRELTVGFCPGVGAVGAMLGGGLGRLEGLHGLTSDAVRSVRMVTWNGTIVQASQTVNEDLFWGIRGAGQNFGIVTEVVFETYPATNGGMQYSSDLTFAGDKLEAVLNVTNRLLTPNLDPMLAIATSLGADPVTLEPMVRVNIVYPGPFKKDQAFRKFYSPFSSNFTEQMVSWTNLTSVAFPDIVAGGRPFGSPHNQYSVLARNLPAPSLVEALDSLGDLVQQHPGLNESTIFIETFGQKALSELPDDYSAFPHRNTFRNAIVFSVTYSDPGLADAADAWARDMRDKFALPEICGYDRLQIYQNYGHGDEPLSALYGYEDWRHERLTALKKKYDPRGLFNGYHAIPANIEDWS
ncbi:hypothetical protein F5Y01DRAFT_312850 [Xylaria sp. FL0043]|nr:hypothetical protein F5Y01DRAFT_312850 [Xylaria sp. FL0043]